MGGCSWGSKGSEMHPPTGLQSITVAHSFLAACLWTMGGTGSTLNCSQYLPLYGNINICAKFHHHLNRSFSTFLNSNTKTSFSVFHTVLHLWPCLWSAFVQVFPKMTCYQEWVELRWSECHPSAQSASRWRRELLCGSALEGLWRNFTSVELTVTPKILCFLVLQDSFWHRFWRPASPKIAGSLSQQPSRSLKSHFGLKLAVVQRPQ